MENNYVLGLDISTSTIGIALFSQDGKLEHVTSYKPEYDMKKINDPTEILFIKAINSINYITDLYSGISINEVIIEEPLVQSNNANTVIMLKFFNGVLSYLCYEKFKTVPKYITTDSARRYGLPELLGYNNEKSKKKTLFGSFPKKIDNVKLNKKLLVLYQISKRYPFIVWTLNNNMTISIENCDMADAITCVLGYKCKNGEWEDTVTDTDKILDFIVYNVAYEKMVGKLRANKDILPKEKNEIKKKYMLDTFKIQEYLNIKIK